MDVDCLRRIEGTTLDMGIDRKSAEADPDPAAYI